MTQDMLRGLNQLINKVAAAVPTNMRAPQPTVHDGLTQQAQTALHQKLSGTQHATLAENLSLSIKGKQLIIGLPIAQRQEGQPSAQHTSLSIPLTDDQVQLVKRILAQQSNPRAITNQTTPLTVSIETLANSPALANTSIKIPAEQRTQIALALLVQANQLAISGQIQGTNKPLANLLSLFVPPLDKVVNVPLQRVPNTLQTLVTNLNSSHIEVSTGKPLPILTIESPSKQLSPSLTSSAPAPKFADIQLALNKHVIAGTLNTQHVATQTFLKAVNQLHNGQLSLPTKELSAIVQRLNSQDSKAFVQALVHTKSNVLLTPQLDKLSLLALPAVNITPSANTANQAIGTRILRLSTAHNVIDIRLADALLKPLTNLITQSRLTNAASTTASMTRTLHNDAKMDPHPIHTRHKQAHFTPLNTQVFTAQSIHALMPVSPNPPGIGQVMSFAQAVAPIINHMVSANMQGTGTPNSEQLLAEVQELTHPDLASLVLHKMTQRQPHHSSPQSTVLSGLATMVQISLASKLQQQLRSSAGSHAKSVAIEQHLNTLIAPHLASLAVQQLSNKSSETNHDPATELLRGITRLLTSHRLQQAVSVEWQTQHPDSQYFTLPNFLSGSKHPIQLLIRQEQHAEPDHTGQMEQQGNKWHISLQFDIPACNKKDGEPQGKLLAKATLQANTVNIALYGSTQRLLDNINQHKQALEQRLRQLGFSVESQPAYQGIINDSLVDWPKPIHSSNKVSV